MEMILLIIGVLVGGFAAYAYLNPKVKATQKLDEELADKNFCLRSEYETLNREITKLEHECSSLISRKDEIFNDIRMLQQQAEESAEAVYKKSYELANEKMDQAAEKMSKKYRDLEQKAEKEYQILLADYSNNFLQEIENKKAELNDINNQISDLTAKLTSMVEANKRAEEVKNKKDFYRLNLPDVDIEEIKKLRSVSQYLRDSEPLNKVIWKVYYEKPYTDLIGRVIGNGIHTGIYKITNIENQMCYVGQAANIADRWKQHIKRGIGAETPTRNKLYPAMLEKGVENFTFEIIEEVERNKLNEREDYWQEYFHAKEFGYSIK